MKLLDRTAFHKASQWIKTNGRPLEQALYSYHFEQGPEESVLNELASFQNDDGGFGQGLEADFRMPQSSPMATSIAFQHLIYFDHHEQAKGMISRGIHYFEETYHEERKGWFAVPAQVNDYPHAFWWKVHEDGMSWIDHHWGNPSAEIIGYLSRYNSQVTTLNIDQLLDHAINHLLTLQKFESEHEIYCYLRLFELVPERKNAIVKQQLQRAVNALVNLNSEMWNEYVPFPLKFVSSPKSSTFGIPANETEKNLDYYIEELSNKGRIEPSWQWNDFFDVWKDAKQEWTGVLTLEVLRILHRFQRIEG